MSDIQNITVKLMDDFDLASVLDKLQVLLFTYTGFGIEYNLQETKVNLTREINGIVNNHLRLLLTVICELIFSDIETIKDNKGSIDPYIEQIRALKNTIKINGKLTGDTLELPHYFLNLLRKLVFKKCVDHVTRNMGPKRVNISDIDNYFKSRVTENAYVLWTGLTDLGDTSNEDRLSLFELSVKLYNKPSILTKKLKG